VVKKEKSLFLSNLFSNYNIKFSHIQAETSVIFFRVHTRVCVFLTLYHPLFLPAFLSVSSGQD